MPEPRIRFLIGGVQKGGTTAMAQCLGLHPRVRLPAGKEAHVFDAPDFADTMDATALDQLYAPHFAETSLNDDLLFGDATPIYCLHERFVQRIARYNPRMRWVILLRDPVERAISHYHMERSRGDEHWPLLPALLLERWRLRGHRDDFSADSPLRHHSYRLRGDYARQLDTLYRYFDGEQVLVLRSDAFRDRPRETLEHVYAHLSLAGPIRQPPLTWAFVGNYASPSRLGPTWALARWLLRREFRAMYERHGADFS